MKNHIHITERTFEFAVRITKLCNLLDQQPGTSRLLANQLFRSGTSIGANLAESQSAQSIKDFISKQEISLKEARETRYWLRLLIETGMIESERIAKLLDECEQLIKILAQSIVTSKKKLNN
ncbi:MAG: four helix bundle protein [Okeania sp. SIO3C4]|nr:four helix bundle protein [Okeania sp. SIO3B3]NER02978.1 four helix bundle protein [Okeania sp. SIO3C4]